ncbi:CPBP family intramembrane glutamic endopeptidase [Carboxydothermus ferrireducens]|uniref:Membrane protease YdiL (CAAX protease family) n=1 Tax=Carboxydothermus ferrireducens DSM 11255 TaxID=1119529 RepID=A0ABX2RBN0_9THEO|nr:CPBP family intramembrane glutamic endopeptidase [Carboxydothermus ferrireducens]NYE58425.1 membrane protease YdiL (CAAX protease family) [Carboxydothermus ferrireducens DSM 11255]
MLQVVVFSLVPFIWWLITAREKENFLHWLGFKKPLITNKKQFFTLFLSSIVLFSLPTIIILPKLVDSSNLAISQFSGKGRAVFLPALIYSFIQTGLSEEILFRGFINKRLSAKFGFTIANFSQALLFGLLHGFIFYSFVGLWGIIIIVTITGSVGWIIGWINEQRAGGSIIPGWLFHASSNLLMSILAMFNLI